MKELTDYLPRRPKVSNKFEFIPIRNDFLLAKSMFKTVGLNGRSVSELLPYVLKLADGTRSFNQILQAIPLVTKEVLIELLQLLNRHGLLEEGDDGQGKEGQEAGNRRQRNFFLQMGDPVRFIERLRKSKVNFFGLSHQTIHALSSLIGSGVRYVKIIRSSFEDEQHDRALMDAAEKIIEGAQHQVFADIISVEEDQWEPKILEGDLSILCVDGPSIHPIRRANLAHLRSGTPWISAHMSEGGLWVVGPTVIPGLTACFQCLELRMSANRKRPFLEKAVQHYFENNKRQPGWGGIEAVDMLIGGFIAMEAIKYLTRFAYPVTINTTITFNIFTLEMGLNPVLRLPRCPSCSRTYQGVARRRWQP